MQQQLKEEFCKTYSLEISTTKGIEALARKIGISKNSLRRFLGKIDAEHQMSISVLNLISIFLGYKDFQYFIKNSVEQNSLDFNILEIFYNTVKGQGIILNEVRFQNANHQFSKKIILNNKNLQEFTKRFSNNYEAMEYVLAWHPTYGKIADEFYQNTLLNFGKTWNVSHIRVYTNCFVLFGGFLSMKFVDEKEVEKQLNFAKKNLIKMRKEYPFFFVFPELRFAIAQTLFYHHFHYKTLLENEIKNQYSEKISIKNKCSKVIFLHYYADCLNLIGRYEEANSFQNRVYEEEIFHHLEEDYHYKRDLLYYKVSRAITLFKTGNIEESKKKFFELNEADFSKIPFDMKDYFEIQFYLLGHYIFPKQNMYVEKLEQKIKETGFSYFKNLI